MVDADAIRQRWEAVGADLDERRRRLLAAAEVRAAGWGGLAAVSRITGLARSTINRGEDDLDATPLPKGRVRRAGGGRRPLCETDPGLLPALKSLVEPATLGDPMRPLIWVSKSLKKLAAVLTAMGHPISADTVRKELVKLGFSRQSNRKADEGSHHPDRNAQFEYINKKVVAAQAKRQPVISVDTKKKELIGNFKNGGTDYRPKRKPPFLKLPISSFFFVSTEMTGCCRTCAATTFALMYSNWALRSGWCDPSSALRLDWREKPSFTSSLRTVSGPIGCPISVSAAASFSRLFDTQIKGRIGSPSVAGCTRRLSAGTSPGSVSQSARRPPPARRTRPSSSGCVSRSSSPRLIVERASPVIFETIARPPRPAVRASAAANSRRPRSSSFAPTASHRCRIASASTMQLIYAASSPTGIHTPESLRRRTGHRDSVNVRGVLTQN